jgi:hypothetical protein
MHKERRNAYRIVFGKPEGKRPLEKLGQIVLKWMLAVNVNCTELA